MARLSDHIRKQRSALLVSTGPSRVHAPLWRPHFNAVATLGTACIDYEGEIDYALFVDWEPTLLCKDAFPRVRNFLCPEELLSLADQNDRRTLEQVGIQRDRAVTFPVNLKRSDKAFECVQGGELYFPWTNGPVTIHTLALLGFTNVFCLGFSDLDGNVSEPYVKFDEMCKATAQAVYICLNCKVTFWNPSMKP